ncbi:iron-sulfur cluster assembly accessory protein [Streptomyces sp. NPDC005202]|uniref:HesB/IscA family protein n=1 Tax=Streptomyces sp. NPDC005202 TaxID=3157021 RepID=UPI0033B5F2EC
MTVRDLTPPSGVVLTDAAASRIRSLLEQEGRDDVHLRVVAQPGDCCGPSYQLLFDMRVLDDDIVQELRGIRVVVDRTSAPYLNAATIDFVDTTAAQGFTIDSPHAHGSCACGDSFR